MKTFNACGISCPEPLLMLKNALKTEKEMIFIVDSTSTLANCEDYAKKKGVFVNTLTEGNQYKIHIQVTP